MLYNGLRISLPQVSPWGLRQAFQPEFVSDPFWGLLSVDLSILRYWEVCVGFWRLWQASDGVLGLLRRAFGRISVEGPKNRERSALDSGRPNRALGLFKIQDGNSRLGKSE